MGRPEYHHLMSMLLTLIKDSVIYKVTFGFDKGAMDSETATTTGKKTTEHHRGIATKLLIQDASGKWADGNVKKVEKLGDLIKNHITA